MQPTTALSLTKAWLLGLSAILGSGVVASGLGYLVQLVSQLVGVAG